VLRQEIQYFTYVYLLRAFVKSPKLKRMGRILLFAIFCGLSSGYAAENDPLDCDELLAAFRVRAPELRDEKGQLITVEEGDWKAFLDRTISLSDGTKIQYRDLDRLSPSFWNLHRKEWPALSRKVSEEVRAELESRGVSVWKEAHYTSEPLNKFNLPLHRDGEHPLNQLSTQLRDSHLPLATFSPQKHMGIVPTSREGSYADSPLPVSLLPLKTEHIAPFIRAIKSAQEAGDAVLIENAFIYGRDGVSEVAGMKVSAGDFQADWPSRQLRRGNRAYRMSKEELSLMAADESAGAQLEELKKEEQRLASEINRTMREYIPGLVEGKPSLKQQQKLVRDFTEYLNATGVPAEAQLKEGRVLIKPLSEEKWREWNQDNTAGYPIEGFEDVPVLTKLAYKLGHTDHHLVVDLVNIAGSGNFETETGNYILPFASIFTKQPLESHLLHAGRDLLPPRSHALILSAHKVSDPIRSANMPQALTFQLAHTEAIVEAIQRLESQRMLMPARSYSLQMQALAENFKAYRESLEHIYKNAAAYRQLRIGPTTPLVPMDFGKGVTAYIVEVGEEGMLFLISKAGVPEMMARKLIHEHLRANTQFVETNRSRYRAIRDFGQIFSEHNVNQLTVGEISDLAKLEAKIAEAKVRRIKQARPSDYFRMLLEEEDQNFKGSVHWAAKARVEQFEKKFATNPRMMADVRGNREIFLAENLPYQVNQEFTSFLARALDSEDASIKREAIDFGWDLVQNAKDPALRGHVAWLIAGRGFKHESFAALVEAALQGSGTMHTSSAAMALVFAYPDSALRLFPDVIRHSEDTYLRTTVLQLLERKKLSSEDVIAASIEALGVKETSGDPGMHGYLAQFVSTDPQLKGALEAKVAKILDDAKEEYELARISGLVNAWDLRSPELLERYRNALARDLVGGHHSVYAKFLLEADPGSEAGKSWYRRQLAEPTTSDGALYHLEKYLQLLKEYAFYYPRDEEAILPAIERIAHKLAQPKGQLPADFDIKAFNEIRRNIGVAPFTLPSPPAASP
jgi:hypothetical protein